MKETVLKQGVEVASRVDIIHDQGLISDRFSFLSMSGKAYLDRGPCISLTFLTQMRSFSGYIGRGNTAAFS